MHTDHQIDIFDRILHNYKRGEAVIWLVCDDAALVVGERDGGTEKLAQLLRKSPDAVERYARAGRMYAEMTVAYPDAHVLRKAFGPSYFDAAGKCYEAGHIGMSDLYEYFREAIDQRWTRERFAAELPSEKGPMDWWRKMSKTIPALRWLKSNPLTGPFPEDKAWMVVTHINAILDIVEPHFRERP